MKVGKKANMYPKKKIIGVLDAKGTSDLLEGLDVVGKMTDFSNERATR